MGYVDRGTGVNGVKFQVEKKENRRTVVQVPPGTTCSDAVATDAVNASEKSLIFVWRDDTGFGVLTARAALN